MSNLYLANREQGGNAYLRYIKEAQAIQAMKENGTWLTIYYAKALPIKDYVYAYKIVHTAADPNFSLTVTQYKTDGSSISETNSSTIYSENIRYAGSGSYNYGHLKITKPFGGSGNGNPGNIICTAPYYVTDSSFWNNNAEYRTANSTVITMYWWSNFTIYIRTTAIAS